MNTPPTMIQNNDIIASLFNYVSSWNTIMSLMLVSHQFNRVGQNLTISLPFCVNSDFSFENFEIPSEMAKVIHVNCDASTKEAFFEDIVNSFTKCVIIGINFHSLNSLVSIKKICKTIIKKGISVEVLSSHDSEEIENIISKLTEEYNQMNKEYNTRQNGLSLMKRKRGEDEFMMLKVPKNKKERQKFLLEHLLRMTDSGSSDEEQSVGNPFSRINHITAYTYDIDVSSLFVRGVQDASAQIKKFINCIVNFNDFL